MNQKASNLCDCCQSEEDSNEHMFLYCETVKQIWREVEEWISQIGVVEYVITEERVILGELTKSHWLNAIILVAKR